jgi:hypothetical protein
VGRRKAPPYSLPVALALRALVLLFAAELSGLTHAALDISASLSGAQHAASDCDDTEGGHECPPGCPNCHCWHAGTPAPQPAIARDLVRIASSVHEAGLVPYSGQAPSGADPASVYRPPRALV